ncbi:hypothetical protein ACH3XW_28400 [Acanthocheilonema viteae]
METRKHRGKLPTSDEIAKRSIDRMVKHMEREYFNNDNRILTTELINKTIMAFTSASFKTIKTTKQPALLPCPQGCESSSEFWSLRSLISLLLSAILAAIIIIKTFGKDRMDQNYALAKETKETDQHNAN